MNSINYHNNNKTDLNPDKIDNELDLCNLSSIENIEEFLNSRFGDACTPQGPFHHTTD